MHYAMVIMIKIDQSYKFKPDFSQDLITNTLSGFQREIDLDQDDIAAAIELFGKSVRNCLAFKF